jgi:hypothetical protein
MKWTVYAFLLIIICNACKKDSLTNVIEFNKSYNVWKDFKASSHNSYSYGVVTSSWVGYNSETVITVQNGQVVGRDFIRTFSTHNGSGWKIDTVQAWKETGAQLGTHEGASLSTLDEIYQEAKNNWLKKRDDADTYFEAKNNGMISTAGYVPKGCADDCFRGISINKITPL